MQCKAVIAPIVTHPGAGSQDKGESPRRCLSLLGRAHPVGWSLRLGYSLERVGEAEGQAAAAFGSMGWGSKRR